MTMKEKLNLRAEQISTYALWSLTRTTCGRGGDVFSYYLYVFGSGSKREGVYFYGVHDSVAIVSGYPVRKWSLSPFSGPGNDGPTEEKATPLDFLLTVGEDVFTTVKADLNIELLRTPCRDRVHWRRKRDGGG